MLPTCFTQHPTPLHYISINQTVCKPEPTIYCFSTYLLRELDELATVTSIKRLSFLLLFFIYLFILLFFFFWGGGVAFLLLLLLLLLPCLFFFFFFFTHTHAHTSLRSSTQIQPLINDLNNNTKLPPFLAWISHSLSPSSFLPPPPPYPYASIYSQQPHTETPFFTFYWKAWANKVFS